MRWVECESLFKGGKRQVENRRIFIVVRFSFFHSLFSFSLKHIQHHHPPLFISIFSLSRSLTHPPLNIFAVCTRRRRLRKKTSLIVVSVDVSLSLFAVFISILLLLFNQLVLLWFFFFSGRIIHQFLFSLSFVYEQRPQKVRSFTAAAVVCRLYFCVPEKIIQLI